MADGIEIQSRKIFSEEKMDNLSYSNSASKYLSIIGAHLREGHAALMVGAGFSRNADKIDESIPNSPLWTDLADEFVKKLARSLEEEIQLKKLDPLVLAERVEVMYGRPELDKLLLELIRDDDYLPSELYRQLLSLPWSDIFTTNYDTLLERASNELTEAPFRLVREKGDLVGSAGLTRIIKLHGSFPSHRPFIITTEDYRTYPEKFAPFVNTVQQSLLENTLCLIGFSGDDPNFQKWIGWIRDNLGRDNCPQIYMLTHQHLSEIDVKMLYRKNVIPVELVQLTAENSSPGFIYQEALNLLSKLSHSHKDTWKWTVNFYKDDRNLLSLTEATDKLRSLHEKNPGWITAPVEEFQAFRLNTLSSARDILSACRKDSAITPLQKLDYLYEYDWLRERYLLPLFSEDWTFYHDVMEENVAVHSTKKTAIQLSMLRTLREDGDWDGWEKLYREICQEDCFNRDQMQQMHWEECLCDMAQYHFQRLIDRLDRWNAPPSMPLWCLRKAGLLAECGKLDLSHDLLNRAISEVRRRLSHLNWENDALLSLESALMELRSYVKQAQEITHPFSGDEKNASCDAENSNYFQQEKLTTDPSTQAKPEDNSEFTKNADREKVIDEHHQALHEQHHVSWSEQNVYFTSRLTAPWVPHKTHSTRANFDFGSTQSSFHFGPDKDIILAYSFLRFREETGIPFQIMNVKHGSEAACGAAERIARYSELSILTLVRANASKQVGNVLTRGILSGWTQEKADRQIRFYKEAVSQAEESLSAEGWFYKESFVYLAADVLPEVLSELCTRCSYPCMQELLDCLEMLYSSPKRWCYPQTSSLMKRLMAIYPKTKHRELILHLIRFPARDTNPQDQRFFPNPLSYVPIEARHADRFLDEPIAEIEELLSRADHDDYTNSKLLYCLKAGLLTESQALRLRDKLWDGQHFYAPKEFLSVICLSLPCPSSIDWTRYLCKELTERLQGYLGKADRPKNDIDILNELNATILSKRDAFSSQEITEILPAFFVRLKSLSQQLQDRSSDFLWNRTDIVALMYSTVHSLWLLIGNAPSWEMTAQDKELMEEIQKILQEASIYHYGIAVSWQTRVSSNSQLEESLVKCLCSTNKDDAEWGYRVLAVSLRYSQYELLPKDELSNSITAISQQIMWNAQQHLPFALQAMAVAVEFRPEMISPTVLSALLVGLSSLEQRTQIGIDDTGESASEKGVLRMHAAALAKALQAKGLCENCFGILETWGHVLASEDEFGEIRNL